jgi:hypothetical protein
VDEIPGYAGERGGTMTENQELVGELLDQYGTWFQDEEAPCAGLITSGLVPVSFKLEDSERTLYLMGKRSS